MQTWCCHNFKISKFIWTLSATCHSSKLPSMCFSKHFQQGAVSYTYYFPCHSPTFISGTHLQLDKYTRFNLNSLGEFSWILSPSPASTKCLLPFLFLPFTFRRSPPSSCLKGITSPPLPLLALGDKNLIQMWVA